ncbi:hypothetical protein DWU99_03285 [Dyella psychrodurans]|uniref:Curli production assembly/transport component CsgG n=2 Tax=Dyella psychrodurans TaxID=1927960 RepID=A0A370XF18_9GAMM|nr:hypothetical protein DWU99_03285 [Dyella psychrodurans]
MKHWGYGAIAGIFALLAVPVNAQTVSEKGMATVPYTGWSLSAPQRQDALKKAEVNALERYIADTNAARSRIFESKQDQFTAHIDDYILGSTVLSENQDKQAKTYSVVIRADINSTRLMNDLGTGASSATDVASAGHNTMTFLFVARSQSSVQSFDDKVYKRTDADSSMTSSTNEGESVQAHNIGTSDSTQQHSSQATTSGGSVTRKADKVDWSVTNASEVDTAMTGIFSDAGYDVVEADQVEGASGGMVNIANIRDAYSHGNDLPSNIMYSTTQGVQRAGIGYFAFGTLDVGMADKDPVSGNVRVFVTVTGKVLNVQGRFARTLVSIGPVQYAGLGPDATVARTNALKEAASQAAHQMVDELSNKGIR